MWNAMLNVEEYISCFTERSVRRIIYCTTNDPSLKVSNKEALCSILEGLQPGVKMAYHKNFPKHLLSIDEWKTNSRHDAHARYRVSSKSRQLKLISDLLATLLQIKFIATHRIACTLYLLRIAPMVSIQNCVHPGTRIVRPRRYSERKKKKQTNTTKQILPSICVGRGRGIHWNNR